MAHLTIFDVQHGACALLEADNGATMLIDCGKSSDTGWSPTKDLIERGYNELTMLAVTNYDEDHVDGLPELRQSSVKIKSLLRNKEVSPDNILQLKSETGMGKGIAALVEMSRTYNQSMSPPDFAGITWKTFHNSSKYFDDENNLSLFIVIDIFGKKVVFTGDVEKGGFDKLLESDSFRAAVADCSILVAPHHGRECSVHEEFLAICNPFWVAISDRDYIYESQKTVPLYASYCRGGSYRNANRKVLTTRQDGTLTFYFEPNSWGSAMAY